MDLLIKETQKVDLGNQIAPLSLILVPKEERGTEGREGGVVGVDEGEENSGKSLNKGTTITVTNDRMGTEAHT